MYSDIEQQYFLENLYANQKKSAKAFLQREEKGRFNEIRKTINSDSLWYAIYFPQFKNLNETQMAEEIVEKQLIIFHQVSKLYNIHPL